MLCTHRAAPGHSGSIAERLGCGSGGGRLRAGAGRPCTAQDLLQWVRWRPRLPAARQITALAFSPDGRALAAADDEGALAVWDLAEARRSGGVDAAHQGPVWALAYSQGAGSLLGSGEPAI